MDSLARASSTDRHAVFRAAADGHRQLPEVVEKDFWVCWVLRRIFADHLVPGIVFKGGTSLSKVWGAINRFSEDIDLTVPRSAVAGADELIRSAEATTTARKAAAGQLDVLLKAWCDEQIPIFRQRFAEALGLEEGWSVTADPKGNGSVIFIYPAGLQSAYSLSTPRRVLLEFGLKMTTTPNVEATIRPICATAGSYTMPDPDTLVTALAIERTLWEKVTTIHAEIGRNDPEKAAKLSRHCYDIAGLLKRPELSGPPDLVLLAQVADEKNQFFYRASANYEAAARGELNLRPSAELTQAFRADYSQNADLYYDDPVVPFDAILEQLAALGDRVRHASKREHPGQTQGS